MEPCVYTWGIKDTMVMLAVYIDNLLVIGATLSHIRSVRQQLSNIFSIMDQGNMSHIIGMNNKYDHESHTLSIDQSRYIKGILEKFGLHEAWSAQSLATEAFNKMGLQQGEGANAEEIRYYTSLVGLLLWIAQGT
ncbi:hypothetical protein NDA14_005655 [Ustilago hordei]|nr:hypothetical protein NDA14_005655 [Ustilago hordei]